MAKPWARTRIGYMRHPKFLALSGNAISLWHEGKDYCDEHHTDGLIPRDALRTFRFNGRATVDSLMRSCGQKPDGTPYAPLWEPHTVGFRMHDYLDHNDCRDAILARIKGADDRRKAERDRKAEWRQKKADKSARVPRNVPRDKSRDTPRDSDGTVRTMSRSTTETDTDTDKNKSIAAPAEPGQSVKAFLALYIELFQALTGEAPDIVRGRDHKIAKNTIEHLGEEKAHARLRDFFASDDKFIRGTGYGLNVFAGQLNKLIVAASKREAEKADINGHVPPCRTWAECRDKVLAQAKSEREAASA
jgi:hypothetical protein